MCSLHKIGNKLLLGWPESSFGQAEQTFWLTQYYQNKLLGISLEKINKFLKNFSMLLGM